MLRGERSGLRARLDEDVPILHEELHDDVPEHGRADSGPWLPTSPGRDWSPFSVREPQDGTARFSVVDLASGTLAGSAILAGLDAHNRHARLGMWLRPAYRGRGLGIDTLRLLCRYGFDIRGLHRLQLETLSDNRAMISTAQRVGFRHEGTLRESAWVDGRFQDEAVLGMHTGDRPPGHSSP
ncbi:GNAT family N-acetyltransferase [Streptomyces sp. TR06-5]|uniref:GNAT family N-acetyltransferase n=1 Tax=Streptomyces sp. TR06-5 TaxID=3385976 RepID=UPI0039A0F3FF